MARKKRPEPQARLWVYNRNNDLMDILEGSEEDMRKQGKDFTTTKGQSTWWCSLRVNGARAAVCRRGVWSGVAP